MKVVQRDREPRELSAWCDDLRERGQRLAKQLDFLLGRLAETEERIAEAFARRALIAPHRADELWHWAWLAHAEAERLRSKQTHLRQAILPRWLDS